MPDSAPSPRLPLLPLGGLTLAMLALEILLARLLAYAVHALLVYVVLGLAMLGFGAASTLVALRRSWLEPRATAAVATWASLAFAALLVVSYAVFLRLAPTLPFEVGWRALLAAAVLTLPFVAAGIVVTVALATAGRRIGRVYAADLVGSSLGCFVPVFFLEPLGAPRLLALIALAGCAAAAGFAWAPGGERRARPAASFLAVVLVVVVVVAPSIFRVTPEPNGQVAALARFAQERGIRMTSVFDRWSFTGRVEIFEFANVPGHPDPYPFRFYAQDNTAGALVVSWDGRDETHRPADAADTTPVGRMCGESLLGQAYFEPRLRVLVIGLGGGTDVQCALYHRAERVDAVEINPATVHALRGPFDSVVGGIGRDPRVAFHVLDGRAFARVARPGSYDLVQLSGVDTKHYLAAGGLALSENQLYTAEAFDDYLRSLAPGGVLSLIRFGEGEAMRLINTAVRALERRGATHPERHLLAAQNGLAFGIVVRGEPFPDHVVRAYGKRFWFTHRPYEGFPVKILDPFDYMSHERPVLIHQPGRSRPPMLTEFLAQHQAGDTSRFESVYPYRIDPVTDDRPFFFDLTRYDLPGAWAMQHVQALGRVLGVMLLLAAVAVLLPLWPLRRALRGSATVGALGYFGAIGTGYLLLEIALLHRFGLLLGHQAYALSTVLATLLMATGVGALFGPAMVRGAFARSLVGPLAGVLLAALAWLVAPALGTLLAGQSLALRMAATALVVAPAGFALGLPFPAGLSLVESGGQPTAAWCVGLNFFASVAASTAAIPIALLHGYGGVLAVGVGAYLLAVAASLGGLRPRRAPSTA